MDKVVLKKGGIVKFPEPSFSVLSKETKKMIKRKFKDFVTDNLEAEPTISFAMINMDYDKEKKKNAAKK